MRIGLPGALLLLLPACVEPAVGPVTGPARSDRAGFAVQVVEPAAAPDASRTAGTLDSISPGAVLVLQGWAASSDARLVVVTEPTGQVLSSVRVERPDAAEAVGHDDVDLGFRITVRTGAQRACVVALSSDGQAALLAGSDPAWCA